MRSTFDILSALYQILNVSAVNDIISGKVYIGDVPDGDQLENISIKTLNNPNSYLQVGYINLNIHIAETKSGRANMAKFQEIVQVIIPLIEDTQSQECFFQIDDDKGIFRDQDQDNMYFYNLKLIFQTL